MSEYPEHDKLQALESENAHLRELVIALGGFLRNNIKVYIGADNFTCRFCGQGEGLHNSDCQWGQIEQYLNYAAHIGGLEAKS